MKKVYVIGDSISIQYGPYLQQALQGILHYARKEGEAAALLNLDNPQGANGGDSGMVLAFLRALQSQGGLDVDLLLLNCGLHDMKTHPQTGQRQVALAQYAENLHGIVAVAQTLVPVLAWIRTTPCDEAVHNQPAMSFYRFAADGVAYNAAADAIMAAAGIPIIDLYTFTHNLGPDLYCDHVHFREPIRTQQAAFLAGWLTHWLALQK